MLINSLCNLTSKLEFEQEIMMNSLGSLDILSFFKNKLQKTSLFRIFQAVTHSRHLTLNRVTAVLSDSRVMGKKPIFSTTRLSMALFSVDVIVLACFVQLAVLFQTPAHASCFGMGGRQEMES